MVNDANIIYLVDPGFGQESLVIDQNTGSKIIITKLKLLDYIRLVMGNICKPPPNCTLLNMMDGVRWINLSS